MKDPCSVVPLSRLLLVMMVWASGTGAAAETDPVRPNVILIITDDQGYGDIAAHGNSMLQTPHLDRLHAESVRLTDFHVDPTCSPTRAALMTGRDSTRTGVWHTIAGRSLMRDNELTLAEVFASAGYRTGMFGKWHLGDHFPLRPHDRGFETCLYHGGGGVGQTPDYWGNDYFDDVYLRNGVPEACSGYCTDVWFREALQFIEVHREERFFCYLSTNAPHGPYWVGQAWKQPYLEAGLPEPMASFYGMIANIDHNIGQLRQRLTELELAENTLLIFMTDNGTAEGVRRGRINNPEEWPGFNAGMRGQKGSEYEGGHRVPCFWHWPAGGLHTGRDVDLLSAHIDLLPTLCRLCGIDKPGGLPIDGRDLSTVLLSTESSLPADLLTRVLFVHSQRIEFPQRWRQSAVMTSRWRLINGRELYDMQVDPGQLEDVASRYPDVVQRLRTAYEAWWDGLVPSFDDDVLLVVGHEQANPVEINCHDWHSDDVPWNQPSIEQNPTANGYWLIDVSRAGTYEFELRLRPAGVVHPLAAGLARVRVNDIERTVEVSEGEDVALLTLPLSAGPARLQTWIVETDGVSRGAFFVTIRRQEP